MEMRERMKTILFIDDSESHRFLLEEELSEEGYKVVTANSIEEVLSKRTDFNPDLVILELRQRNANDGSLVKLKTQYPNTPWIGYSTFNQCPEEFKKWVHFYLQKSWETEGLKGLIKNF
jgi:DNA-binding NtrC family response regulator